MSKLEDVLKKLNKGKKEEDQFKILGDTSLIRGVVSSGSPYLDYITNGTFLDGGYNTIVADGGTGKSSMALLACKDVQTKKGKIAVYYDGEGTLNDSYIDRMGIDRSKFLHIKGRNLEEMLDTVEAFSTADDVGIIIIDSINIFFSTTVEEKSAMDNHMAVEARRFTSRMPLIEGNAMNRGICIIGLTSYKLDPGAMGDPRKLSRGNWQYTMSNTILDLTRKDFIKNDEKEVVGHKIDIRIKKTKNSSYDPKQVITLNFYYNGGFNEIEEYSRLMIEKEIVNQGGAWISFPNEDAEEVKLQGIDTFMNYLKENKITYEYLKSLL